MTTHDDIDAPATAGDSAADVAAPDETSGAASETAAPGSASLHADEGGNISIFFMFGVLAVVLLMALLVNTARHTTTRVEVQNAADAATLAEGAWAARGLNLMTLNNCGMGDILALMVLTRATLETTEVMVKILPPLAVVCAFVGMETSAGAFTYEATIYTTVRGILTVVDKILTFEIFGFGVLWGPMRVLDSMNSVVAQAFPVAAAAESKHLARLNLNDSPSARSFVVPGKASATYVMEYPMVRAEPKEMIDFTGGCPLPTLRPGPYALFAAVGTPSLAAGTPSAVLAIAIYEAMVWSNLSHLKEEPYGLGFNVEDFFDDLGIGFINDILDLLGTAADLDPTGIIPDLDFTAAADTGPLDWPSSNPPKPHKLEADGSREIKDVKPYLQFLGVVHADMGASPLGSSRFLNRAPDGWIAYAQAHVYNPKSWDMFHQDWKVKLAPATLLVEKRKDVKAGMLAFAGVVTDFPGIDAYEMPDSALEYVNNH